MDRKKKITLISIGALEVALVVFCLVVSIMVLATLPKKETDPYAPGMIGWFQQNQTPFFLIIVLPLFIILGVDVVYLIMFATKKESSLTDKEREQIEELAKEQARAEVLEEMKKEMKKELQKEKK